MAIIPEKPASAVEERIQASFAALEPTRAFSHCRVVENRTELIVRIFHFDPEEPHLLPMPYGIYRFQLDSGVLELLTGDDAAPYRIENYK